MTFIFKPRFLFTMGAIVGFCLSDAFAQPVVISSPTGSYPVGTETVRIQTVASGAGEAHELRVQVWYPTSDRPLPVGSPEELPGHPHSSPALISKLKEVQEVYPHVSVEQIRTVSTAGAPLISTSTPLPLILYAHGLAMDRFSASFTCEDLASHGYLVMSPDHPYYAKEAISTGDQKISFNFFDFLDRPRFTEYPGNFRGLLDQIEAGHLFLQGHNLSKLINFEKISMFGHSFGAGATLHLSQTDSRIRSVVALDGVPWKTTMEGPHSWLAKPTQLFLARDTLRNLEKNTGISSALIQSSSQTQPSHPGLSTYHPQPGTDHPQVSWINGAEHYLFCDDLLIGELTRLSLKESRLKPEIQDELLRQADQVLKLGSPEPMDFLSKMNSVLIQFFRS